MIEIGFHTDAFNSSYWNFEQCLQWAQKNDVHWIECGMIDGVSWIHGLGTNRTLPCGKTRWCGERRPPTMALSSLRSTQPTHYPYQMEPVLGVEYILRTIRWAYLAGCDHIDTTDDRFAPKGFQTKRLLRS
jgi:inosose dehydratase